MLVEKASTDLVRKPYQGLRKSNEVGRGFIIG